MHRPRLPVQSLTALRVTARAIESTTLGPREVAACVTFVIAIVSRAVLEKRNSMQLLRYVVGGKQDHTFEGLGSWAPVSIYQAFGVSLQYETLTCGVTTGI